MTNSAKFLMPLVLLALGCGAATHEKTANAGVPGFYLNGPSNPAQRNIYILNARGICSDCASAIQKMLTANGRSSQIIDAAQIPSEVRKGIDVIVVPGGENYDKTMSDLRKAKADKFITEHVNAGGIYFGHCLGADITQFLEIYPGTSTDPAPDKDPLAVETSWDGGKTTRVMYFEDGPRFNKLTQKVKVLATFEAGVDGESASNSQTGIPAGEPAAITYPWGQGQVGLISPHPEADDEWMAELGSEAPASLTYDLGAKLYDAVLGPVE